MEKIKDTLEWTFKLYALTLVIPIALSVVNIIFCGIFGLHSTYGFWMNFKIFWVDYYFTGSLCDIAAWKWQLGLLFLAFIFTLSNK